MLKVDGRIQFFIRLAPIVVLIVGLAITFLLWNKGRHDAQRDLQNEFDDDVAVVHANINERLDNYRDILRGAAGLFAASQSVERNEFHAYVNSMHLEKAYPGIQGLGFSLWIPEREKKRQIEAVRREGFPKFSISPDGLRNSYTAIVYLEPFDWRNQRAFGYDMYSEPTRREAMERARDENVEAMSGRVVLLQETEKDVQSGFLMYKPVYLNQYPHGTLDERRSKLAGWVYEPFRMNDLMNKGVLGQYLDTIRNRLDIHIYDGNSPDPKNLMFDSFKKVSGNRAQFVSIRSAQYFGRTWTIEIRSLPAFEAKLNMAQARTTLTGGVMISLLLTLVVWLLSTTNSRAINLAGKMSERLEQTLAQTVSAMAAVTEMRDPYTAGHQKRAADLANAIAGEMGLNGPQIQALNFAAMTYEIGKIQIPAEILSRPGRLNKTERDLINIHPQAGYDILKEIDFPWPIAQIVLQHHERLDGSGYPQGLKGDEILLEARIIAVADVVEAMFSHRPYRPALGVDAALAEIVANKGVLYDPAVVDACVRLFRERGFSFAT